MKLKFSDSMQCVFNDSEMVSEKLRISESPCLSSSEQPSIAPSSVNIQHCTLCNDYSNSQ